MHDQRQKNSQDFLKPCEVLFFVQCGKMDCGETPLMQPDTTANSSAIDALLKNGIAAAKAKRVDEARQLLMQVVERDERNEQAWVWLSGVVESLDDRRVCLENVLALNPNNSLAQQGLRWLDEHAPVQDHCPHCNAPLPLSGQTCPACKQPVLIICPACEEYVEVDAAQCPNCRFTLGDFHHGARYYLALADAHLEHDRRPAALTLIDDAEATSPSDPEVLAHLAELNARLDRFDNAIGAYRQAITVAPDAAEYAVRLGAVYRRLGQRLEARGVYEQAYKRTADHPAILIGLAQSILESGGSPLEAIDLFERAVQLQPDDAAVHAWLGKLYVNQADQPAAIKHYRRAAELAEPTSMLSGEVRRELTRLQAALPRSGAGWGDLVRQMIGLMLIPIFAALSNAQLSPLKISLVAWLALFVASFAAYLSIATSDLPDNPLTKKVLGDKGLQHTRGVKFVGRLVWLSMLIVIIVKV